MLVVEPQVVHQGPHSIFVGVTGRYSGFSRMCFNFAAMLDGLLNVNGGDSVLPSVHQFSSEPSQYSWEDDIGDTDLIEKGEGGEQRDPLMLLLFSFRQHTSLIFFVFLFSR